MPALTMRGRYLMREYWSDSDLFRRLTADQRELYQGLWMLADDSGWLPRDIPGIAAALYRFEDNQPRETRIRVGLARLKALGKLETYRCGCLHLPAVGRYPRAGNKTHEHSANHQTHLNKVSAQPQRSSNGFDDVQTGLNPSPVPSSPDLSRRDARTREGNLEAVSEFQRHMGSKGANLRGNKSA